jgi:hypothetical protein
MCAPAGKASLLPDRLERGSHHPGREGKAPAAAQQQLQPAAGAGEGSGAAGDASLGESPAASTSMRRAAQGSSVAGGSPSRAASMLYEYDPEYIERKCGQALLLPVSLFFLSIWLPVQRLGRLNMCCPARYPATA